MSEDAPTCPKCGKPNSSLATGLSAGLTIGIVFIPIIFAWFTLRKGVSTKARVVSFLWMLIVIGAAGGSQPEKPAKRSALPATSSKVESLETTTSSKIKTLQVTPSALFRAYEDNEIRADNTYKNRYVKMTGRIDDIGKDLLGNIYVTIVASDFFGIQVLFNDEDSSEVANLSKGETITVVCKVQGLMANVLCKDAVLM